MIAIFPTELLLTVLRSGAFSHDDLTQIALTCRSFLPFARTRLYEFIQLEYHAPLNGYALCSAPGTNENSRGALAVLRSNRPLRPLVKKVLIRGDTICKPSQDMSVGLVTQLLSLCTGVSIIVLTAWQHPPTELESVFAETKKSRVETGNSIKLSVHVDLDDHWAQQRYPPSRSLAPALQSFDTIKLGQNFIVSILANSKASLRAIGIHLADAPLFKKFPNIATLHLYNSSLSAQNLYDAVHQFNHLNTLVYNSLLPETNTDGIVTVLRLPLPPTLRCLSVEHLIWRPSQVVDALPNNTALKLLNFRRPVFLDGEIDRGMLKASCQRKGIRLTFGELWNLWDNLCTSVSLVSVWYERSVEGCGSRRKRKEEALGQGGDRLNGIGLNRLSGIT